MINIRSINKYAKFTIYQIENYEKFNNVTNNVTNNVERVNNSSIEEYDNNVTNNVTNNLLTTFQQSTNNLLTTKEERKECIKKEKNVLNINSEKFKSFH